MIKRALYLTLILLPLSMGFEGDSPARWKMILEQQTGLLQGDQFFSRGITGKGIRIAVIDAGFKGADTHPGLAHLFTNHRIAATWDFVRNRENVFTGNKHGIAVLSCIAGMKDGKPTGLAPDATFLLARTEVGGEPRIEEINWAKAVEWAIENGADIIQSSIGYTHERYFPEELTGRYSLAAKAALKAARAGILLVNSAGNEGSSHWQTLDTPADADSILTVGAIDPISGIVAQFSSKGPTADGRMKPNVCASGTVCAFTTNGKARIMDGTSFSAPLISGFAACLMQLMPDASAQEILQAVGKSGHLYPYYDYSHGYGVPQASYFFQGQSEPLHAEECRTIIGPADESFQVTLEGPCLKLKKNEWSDYMYYHISDSAGMLRMYGVREFNPLLLNTISRKAFQKGDVLRVYIQGNIAEWRE